MKQYSKRNLSMMMDLYEITMANGYFTHFNHNEYVTFDVFYRKNPDNGGYAIFAGLEQILDYLENFHFEPRDIAYFNSLKLFDQQFLNWLSHFQFKGDVFAMPEGTIIYPNEPVITVHASVIEAQFIETALLSQFNHQSLIATKAQRIVQSAQGRTVTDFGARRAHNIDAAVYGARAAYIGGVTSTATLLAGQMFKIPVTGTMSHSWIMYHDDEYSAFKHFAQIYPNNAIFLVDTYDVLRSGVPNAIKVAQKFLLPNGKRLKGIRLDSGDLATLSKEARQMLDAAGLKDCQIIASNSLDEITIRSILEQKGAIDIFGVGERLITAQSDPVFGGVYKLVATQKNKACQPKIKISETFEKITNPGRKKIWRIYDQKGMAIADLLTHQDEKPDFSKEYRYIDPQHPWEKNTFVHVRAKELQALVMQQGHRIQKEQRSLLEIRNYVQKQLKYEIPLTEQRFENPHFHPLTMSFKYYQMKKNLLNKLTC